MAQFDYFVVFAEMRTGSNFLEANLNSFDGISCYGEAFNPHFIGYPDSDEILGVDQATRDNAPQVLVDAVRDAPGIGGFRFFNNHDHRVLDICLSDPRCAKIILTRNPLDSFVSWKIAIATGQWKLTNTKHAKFEKIDFDPLEFERYVSTLQGFQVTLMNGLQRTGQTAFYVAYEDLQDVDIMNGLAKYLGVEDRITNLDSKLKKQNPAEMASKVNNVQDIAPALAKLDQFNLSRTPSFDPRRGPLVPTYVAGAKAPVLFMPLKSGPVLAVEQWMAALDGTDTSALQRDFKQKTLRDWKAQHPGHRSFTVIRHPVAWAHAAFCNRILETGPGSYAEIRATLRRMHDLPIPEGAAVPEWDPDYDLAAHRLAFLSFLDFLRKNLAGQTAIRIDPAWATQISILQSMSGFALPDIVIREDDAPTKLAQLATDIGHPNATTFSRSADPQQTRLAAIYDTQIEAAARAAYGRDYLMFGFGDYAA